MMLKINEHTIVLYIIEVTIDNETALHTTYEIPKLTKAHNINLIYLIKYIFDFFPNPYLYTQYGSYQILVKVLAIAEANNIPNTPHLFPKTTEKIMFSIAVPHCINLP